MKNTIRYYSNHDITVFWVPSKCSHATTCFRELIEVFNPRKRPWVNMQGAPTERIIEVVDKCPTQALSWKYNHEIKDFKIRQRSEPSDEITPEDVYEGKDMQKKEGAKISLLLNGPILAEGNFSIIGPEGNELKTVVMTSFCRCGNSRSQPFCDGTHRKVGFKG